jgi:creatinine amidohydrolase
MVDAPGRPRLADRPWPEVGRPTVLVPLGSTEQHGPHLPLDTDTGIAAAVCDRLARRLAAAGEDAAVAPAIAYGASGEHEGFPGTVSIGTEVLTALLVEYGRSACAWAGRVVFVNGHGGNVDALSAAVPALIRESRRAAWLPCGSEPVRSAARTSAPPDAHAGRTETSILLALEATRVRAERLEPGNAAPIAELMPELRAVGLRPVAPNGILGDPTGANADEGARVLAAIADAAWRRLREGRADSRGCLVADAAASQPVADGGA